MPHMLNGNTAKTQLLEQLHLQLAQIPDYKRRVEAELQKIADPLISEFD